MVVALSIDNSGSFPRVATKRKTKVSVGFEWEIPVKTTPHECDCFDEYDEDDEDAYCSCDEDDTRGSLKESTKDFARSHGFRTHYECGGAEFASPVFGNIATARRMAVRLKEVSSLDSFLGHNTTHCCGIHVHASHKDYVTLDQVKGIRDRIAGMLHRSSSAAFMLEFSGRAREGTNASYRFQARSTRWDKDGSTKLTDSIKCGMQSTAMLRLNQFGANRTLEYRLWHTAEDRLLPAIDFAHACTTFIASRKDIPYLKDFKAWLDKQSGYKILKQDDAWRLL
jgi:hypothetical protein